MDELLDEFEKEIQKVAAKKEDRRRKPAAPVLHYTLPKQQPARPEAETRKPVVFRPVEQTYSDHPYAYGGNPHMPASSYHMRYSNPYEYAARDKPAVKMKGAGKTWEDKTLTAFPENDFRLFAGNLGNEVTDDLLARTFNKFPSFAMARVVRDRKSGKTKGYGFVSFKDPSDYAKAFKEFNGKYVGHRPITLRKSKWKERKASN